ncbi:hypothetical protein NQV17_29805 [Burkholderia sp. SCN-KJ]|nr:hypothetical protein [Burkholderia sp. SCN-KJ]MCR4470448.1 hypothetical protein [Burkholderia sp. SCN-KJ]
MAAGLYAPKLDALEMLLEYTGEPVDWEVAVARLPIDPDHTFFFDLGSGHVIDGAAGEFFALDQPFVCAELRRGRSGRLDLHSDFASDQSRGKDQH